MDSPSAPPRTRSESPWPAPKEEQMALPGPSRQPSPMSLPKGSSLSFQRQLLDHLCAASSVPSHTTTLPLPRAALPLPTRVGSPHSSTDDEEPWPIPSPYRSPPLPRPTSPSPISRPPYKCTPRSELRWLHAGIFRDIRSHVHDIWYAFTQLQHGGYKILYASDNAGSVLGNYDVGQMKINMITWDEHHAEEWNHLYSGWGTWQFGKAMAGRRLRRDSLLRTYLNPTFFDPFPRGTDRRTIGPPPNVIHREVDKSKTAIRIEFPVASSQNQEMCYASTNIPMSLDGINIGAYKHENPSAITVIASFLTGSMVFNTRYAEAARDRIQSIESAFFEMGWRVDRDAISAANGDLRDGSVRNVLESPAWIRSPPLKIDMHKGNAVEELIASLSSDSDVGEEEEEEEEDEDEDEDGDDNDNGGGDGGGGGDEDEGLFVSDNGELLSTHPSDASGDYPSSRMDDMYEDDVNFMMEIYPGITASEASEMTPRGKGGPVPDDDNDEDEDMDNYPVRSPRSQKTELGFIEDEEDEDEEDEDEEDEDEEDEDEEDEDEEDEDEDEDEKGYGTPKGSVTSD